MTDQNGQEMKTGISREDIIESFKPFDPERIILFGSYARGEQDEWSDLDLIVVYRTEKRFLDRLKELYLAWSIPKGVDILAYTPEEFAGMVKENPFVQQVCREGMTIYEK